MIRAGLSSFRDNFAMYKKETMDSIEFQELLSANANKFCKVILKDGNVYEGVNAGIEHDGLGHLILRLENKGGNHPIAHSEVQSMDFHDEQTE